LSNLSPPVALHGGVGRGGGHEGVRGVGYSAAGTRTWRGPIGRNSRKATLGQKRCGSGSDPALRAEGEYPTGYGVRRNELRPFPQGKAHRSQEQVQERVLVGFNPAGGTKHGDREREGRTARDGGQTGKARQQHVPERCRRIKARRTRGTTREGRIQGDTHPRGRMAGSTKLCGTRAVPSQGVYTGTRDTPLPTTPHPPPPPHHTPG